MTEAIEIIQGKLYALGGVAETSGSLTWVPEHETAPEPINAFLLTEPDEALMVDTGVAAHGPELVQQTQARIGPSTPLTVMFTRFEGDTLTNLGATMRHFALKAVVGGGVSNPFDFFDDLSPQEQIKEEHAFDLTRMRAGEAVTIGGDRRIEILSTSLRNLTTSWLYDEGTKTLFTSDAFGYEPLPTNDRADLVIRDVPEQLDLERLHPRLFTKFDWMLLADPAVLIADLERVFTQFDVEVIAPTHGRVLVGKDVVRAYYDATVALLQQCGRSNADVHV